MRKWAAMTVVGTLSACCCLAADAKPGEPVTVLDAFSVWRTFHLLKPPVIQFDAGPKPILSAISDWCNRETPAAPTDWTKPEFDDTSWLRSTAGAFCRSPYVARLYQRARFEVTDPAQVKGLKLTVGYYGGVIVYLNGQELARGHLAKTGEVDLAEGYSPEAFVSADGKFLPDGQEAARERTLADVAIPAKFLRKGVNVVALEIVRAPYNKIIDEKKDTNPKAIQVRGCPYTVTWNTCETRGVKLTAAAADGLVPNVGRTKQWQAWNADLLTMDYDSDLGDRCVPLGPVTIRGVRNGWFSGKMAVGSPKPIEGLKATVTDLKQGASAIPASAVRVRYGFEAGGSLDNQYDGGPYAARLIDGLLEAPLEVFPVPGRYGAVVPIWVTVKVPADAKAGAYTGQLTVSAKGEQTITVPVKLEVADWTLPDQDKYRTWVELIQSPDTLALGYNVPLWSDRHWELMAQSLRYIGEMGTRTTYLPLIAHTNFGNAESMVRWIKKADGSYDYDFSVMDKYLDLVEKNMGRAKIVCFPVWEVYLRAPDKAVALPPGADPTERHNAALLKKWELRGKGPAVTALDPATGQTETINLPRFEDPAAKALWKPLFDELHKRMAKRGLEKTMALGMISDILPSKEEVTMLYEVSGQLPWVNHAHSTPGPKVHNLAPICYVTYVWNNVFPVDPPAKKRYHGWKRPELATLYQRSGPNYWSLSAILHVTELNITGQQRGLGRIAADFWRVIKDAKGRGVGQVADRYPESFWHSLNIGGFVLAPGPSGPVALTRYEILREGIQECEARIAIEQVLTDEALKARLGPELAQKSQDVLDERLRAVWRSGSRLALSGRDWFYATGNPPVGDAFGHWTEPGHRWFISSGWQEQTQKFYTLAGEVERAANAK